MTQVKTANQSYWYFVRHNNYNAGDFKSYFEAMSYVTNLKDRGYIGLKLIENLIDWNTDSPRAIESNVIFEN